MCLIFSRRFAKFLHKIINLHQIKTHFKQLPQQESIPLKMDNISNLSSNLPPTNPINDQSLQKLNNDLTLEFKNAAKSVASLYKLSLQRNSQLKHQGYLDCINDLLNLIKNDGDVENWALMKKLELDGRLINSQKDDEVISDDEKDISLDDKLQMSNNTGSTSGYQFTVSSNMQRKFPQTNPILSVDRSHKKKFKNELAVVVDSLISSEGENDDENVLIDDESGSKRKLESLRIEKRPKY